MKQNKILFLLILFVFIGCSKPGELFKEATCITNISTIDANNGLISNQTIILKDGKILKIAKSKDLKLSPENKIIDGTGKFLIPGLWDAHVHFAYIEEMAPSMFDLFLSYGVTSVRDTGGKIDFLKKWKNESTANPTTTPRVMIAGPLLDGMPNVYDGSSPARPPLSVGLATPEAALLEVEKLDSIGVDLLKAYEMLSPEQFFAIAKRAKEKGLPLTGHIPLSMDAITASNAGFSSIEHLRNVEMSTAKNADELLEQRKKMLALGKDGEGSVLRKSIHESQRREAVLNADEEKTKEVITAFAENKTWQIPTFMVMTSFVDKPFASKDWQETFKYLPPDIEEKWRDGVATVLEMEVTEDRKIYKDWFFETVGKMNKANVGIMAGTDCPIFYLTPGYSLHHELIALVKAGLTPLEAIESATLSPARYFKMEKELGLISEGMFADLVILDANPLDDIQNTKKINTVIKQGNVLNRAALDEKMKQLDQ